MSSDNFDKNKRGVRFKTCMCCKNNDHDMRKIGQKMYRKDTVEEVREITQTYDEANKEK